MSSSSSTSTVRAPIMYGVMSLGLLLVALPWQVTCQSTCQLGLATLAPCQPYVTGSNMSTPAPDCCTPLGALLTSQPACFCQLSSMDVSFNVTLAQRVVDSCNVTIPSSVLACLAQGPAIAPSVESSPPPTKGAPPSRSSKNGTENGESNGNSLFTSSIVYTIFIGFACAFSFL